MHRSAFCLFIIFFLSAVVLPVAAETPESIDGATTIKTAQAKKLFDDSVLFIDVRNAERFAAGHISSAINLDNYETMTPQTLSRLAEKNTPIVLYCDGVECGRSAVAAKQLVSWGFTKVYYYREGFPKWRDAGYPVD
jgi:rhodanese-related sulfurtransferase